MAWKTGRGALGALKPLIGRWVSEPSGRADKASAMTCTREFSAFGDKAVQLDARWAMGKGREYREYREVAFIHAGEKGKLGFASFTNDGKSSQGTQCDGRDIHPQAIAFEAKMPAGLARMAYWPTGDGEGFHFAVESKTKKGWKRFFLHTYRRAT
jgi:hypothetical protein